MKIGQVSQVVGRVMKVNDPYPTTVMQVTYLGTDGSGGDSYSVIYVCDKMEYGGKVETKVATLAFDSFGIMTEDWR